MPSKQNRERLFQVSWRKPRACRPSWQGILRPSAVCGQRTKIFRTATRIALCAKHQVARYRRERSQCADKEKSREPRPVQPWADLCHALSSRALHLMEPRTGQRLIFSDLAGFGARAAARKYFKVAFTERPTVSWATLTFQLHADSTARKPGITASDSVFVFINQFQRTHNTQQRAPMQEIHRIEAIFPAQIHQMLEVPTNQRTDSSSIQHSKFLLPSSIQNSKLSDAVRHLPFPEDPPITLNKLPRDPVQGKPLRPTSPAALGFMSHPPIY